MPQNPDITVVIPNYNGARFITDCLKSVSVAAARCPKTNFEIIVVDNGSTDNSLDILKTNFPSVKIIINKQNLGFAAAVNRGINNSSYEYVCLINNDISLAPDWFELIIREFSNYPNVASFSGTTLNADGSLIESQGLNFTFSGKCGHINHLKPFEQSILTQKPNLVWGASAAAIIYRKSVLQKIGLFDEDFFAYEEDVDIALRLNRHGFQSLLIPRAVSCHYGGGTSRLMGNFRNIMDAKNWWFIIIKDYPKAWLLKYFFQIIIERLRNLSGLIKQTLKIYGLKSFYLLPESLIRAYLPVLFLLPKKIKQRRQIQTTL